MNMPAGIEMLKRVRYSNEICLLCAHHNHIYNMEKHVEKTHIKTQNIRLRFVCGVHTVESNFNPVEFLDNNEEEKDNSEDINDDN